MIQKIEISYRTIIFTFLFAIGALIVYQIRDILLSLFISLILVGALNPTVDKLEKRRIPRWLAIVLVYLVFVLGIAVGVVLLLPTLVDQSSQLIWTVAETFKKVSFLGITPAYWAAQLQSLGSLPAHAARIIISFFSNAIAVFAILMTTFYLLLEHRNLDRYLLVLFGELGQQRVKGIIERMELKLGGWVRAQLFLMTLIGILSYIGFRTLGLNFALPLAIVAGLFEIVPNIGPILAAVPAVLIGFTTSPLMALLVLAWAFIIQQLENNLIVPKLMQKSVGVNPIVTILALAIGFKLAGTSGAVLAVPIFLTLEVLAHEFVFPSSSKKLGSE